MSKMRKRGGFDRHPLGGLSLTDKEKENRIYPIGQTLSNTTKERKLLLEDFRSGYITREELRAALAENKD